MCEGSDFSDDVLNSRGDVFDILGVDAADGDSAVFSHVN